MNCDIIKDLLPSYIDGVCSDESRNVIDMHLQQCRECKKYYDEIKSDVPVLPEISEEILAENLEEKNLFIKGKDCIQSMLAGKIIRIINIISIILNVLLILCGILFICFAYDARYLYITFNMKYFIALLFSISPIILGIIEIITLKKIKYYVFRIISNIAMQSLLLFGSLVTVIGIFIILPPLESRTGNIENYLEVDNEVQEFHSVYTSFFPDKIPEQAENIEYFYSYKEGIFSERIQMIASWSLPKEEYINIKKAIMDNCYVQEAENNNWKVTIKNVRYPEKVNLNFIYDDDSQTVKYIFQVHNKF